MVRKNTRTPNTHNYRAPDRMPEREQQWQKIQKAMSAPIEPPGKSQARNVNGRRRNPR